MANLVGVTESCVFLLFMVVTDRNVSGDGSDNKY